MVVRLPSGSTIAILCDAASNTLVNMFPNGSVRLVRRLAASYPVLLGAEQELSSSFAH